MERVVSKHLFNNQLDGVLDKECEEMLKQATASSQMEELKTLLDPTLEEAEWIEGMRKMVDMMFVPMAQHPSLVEANNACIHTKFEVLPREGNDFAVPVLVHTPKTLETNKDNAAIIYAHGGGAVAGSAEVFQPWLSKAAVTCGVVYFNVDYRLAPETKCPKNVLDFYCAIKHVIEHASEYGIDPNKIAIAGDSGGGYIAMGAMVMLAQKDEGHLIKLAIPGIPMINDYEFGDEKSMTKEERESAAGMRKIWKCLATDLDTQRNDGDPLLFPAKANDELIAKFPPTIIWETEFDFYLTESSRMARRLRATGRLLEFYVLPGALHSSTSFPQMKLFEKSLTDYKLAIETYLL